MPNKSHWSQRNTYIQESSWTLGFTWKSGSTPAAQREPLDQRGLSFTGGLAKLKADGIHWAARCSVSAPTLQNQKWTQLLCLEGRTQGCFRHSRRIHTLDDTLHNESWDIFTDSQATANGQAVWETWKSWQIKDNHLEGQNYGDKELLIQLSE